MAIRIRVFVSDDRVCHVNLKIKNRITSADRVSAKPEFVLFSQKELFRKETNGEINQMIRYRRSYYFGGNRSFIKVRGRMRQTDMIDLLYYG